MKTRKLATCLSLIGGTAMATQPATAAEGLAYSYLKFEFIGIDVDDFQDSTSDITERYDDGSGGAIEGSIEVAEHVFLYGRYSDFESDVGVATADEFFPGNTDITRLDLGVGFDTPISDRMDLVSRVGYTDIDFGEFELGVSSNLDDLNDDSSDGFFGDIGIRSQFADNLEGSVGLRYLTIDSNNPRRDVDNTSVIGSILFEVSDEFDIDFSVDVGDEFRTYGIGFRYSPMDSRID